MEFKKEKPGIDDVILTFDRYKYLRAQVKESHSMLESAKKLLKQRENEYCKLVEEEEKEMDRLVRKMRDFV